MHRLTKSNIYRLLNFKPFWITLIIINITQALLSFTLVNQGNVPIEFTLFLSLIIVGLLSPFYLSIFYGIEYSDGTMRNKIIAGFNRSTIYLGSLVIGIIATSALYFSSLLVGLSFSMKTNIFLHNNIYHYLFVCIVGWLTCITISTIFNLIGTLCMSKSKASITSIITTLVLFISGMICYSLYGQSSELVFSNHLFQFLFDINPFVHGIQLLSVNVIDICKIGIYSIITIFIINSLGLYQFVKKDMK